MASAGIAGSLEKNGGALQILGNVFATEVEQAKIQASARTACVAGALEKNLSALHIFRHTFTFEIHQAKTVACLAFAAIASSLVKFRRLRKLTAVIGGRSLIKEVLG